MKTFKDNLCAKTEYSDAYASEEERGNVLDPGNLKVTLNVGGILQMDISTLKSGAKTLTGQGHTPADDPNQINYAEVASEEEQEAPGVN